RRHAIVVLLGPFRVQLCAARNACAHFFSFLAPEYAAARRWYRRTTISRIRDNTIGPPAVPPTRGPRAARRASAWGGRPPGRAAPGGTPADPTPPEASAVLVGVPPARRPAREAMK